MTLPFFLWVAASILFRLLGVQAEQRFQARLRSLLPRKVLSANLPILVSDYREQLPLFRTQVLPLRAWRVAFDTLCCSTFLAALWIFPPVFLNGFDLTLLRYAGLAVVTLALVADGAAFFRMVRATSGQSGDSRRIPQ